MTPAGCGKLCAHTPTPKPEPVPLRTLLDAAYAGYTNLRKEPSVGNLQNLLEIKRSIAELGFNLKVFVNGTVAIERLPHA